MTNLDRAGLDHQPQNDPAIRLATDVIVESVRASDFVTHDGPTLLVGFPETTAEKVEEIIEWLQARIRQTVSAPVQLTVSIAREEGRQPGCRATIVMTALSFLYSLDAVTLILLFWYTLVLEIPRYTIGAAVVLACMPWSRSAEAVEGDFTISILLVGHNEADCLRTCVESLAEQTVDRSRMEIIVVDDGSTDGMVKVAHDLQRDDLVQHVMRAHHRGGKTAGLNLALGSCTGDIVVIADADTTFDRDAIAMLVEHFADPRVGAVAGNLGVRNASTNLVTRHQAIEYAIAISLGRSIADALGILSIVSGAFGAGRPSKASADTTSRWAKTPTSR